MHKLMFVCLGNICRSPLAHALMDHLVNEAGCADGYQNDSSGTSSYHIEEPSDSRMRRTAHQHGVSIDHRAQELTKNHLAHFDYIFAMDAQNYRDIISICNAEQKKKVYMLRDFDLDGPGDVPDPYYGGASGFEMVYAMAQRSCQCILDQLTAEGELRVLAL